jgi:hypothetical protein
MRITCMQIISVVLVLISIGTILGPVGAVVIMYSDNLSALVVPPEIQGIMGGEGGGLFGGGNGGGNTMNGGNQGENGGLISPEFVDASFDVSSRTFTATANIRSGFDYALTVNSLSADVLATQDLYKLGTITLTNAPVTIPAGQTVQVTVSGSWTQETENHVLSNYPGATSINVGLANMVIDVNGITVQMNGAITEPFDVPLR